MKINIDLIYPIGAVYISTNTINPSTLFGGEWQQIKDRFLLACGDTYDIGKQGGEATHKLTVDEIPSHSHQIDLGDGNIVHGGSSGNDANITLGGHQWRYASKPYTKSTGEDQPHNNMPPYLAVCVWERIG